MNLFIEGFAWEDKAIDIGGFKASKGVRISIVYLYWNQSKEKHPQSGLDLTSFMSPLNSPSNRPYRKLPRFQCHTPEPSFLPIPLPFKILTN